MLKGYLLQFAVLLDTFHDLLEVCEVLKSHSSEADSFKDRILPQEISQVRSRFLHDASLLEPEIYDAAPWPYPCGWLFFLFAQQFVLDLLLRFVFLGLLCLTVKLMAWSRFSIPAGVMNFVRTAIPV